MTTFKVSENAPSVPAHHSYLSSFLTLGPWKFLLLFSELNDAI